MVVAVVALRVVHDAGDVYFYDKLAPDFEFTPRGDSVVTASIRMYADVFVCLCECFPTACGQTLRNAKRWRTTLYRHQAASIMAMSIRMCVRACVREHQFCQ